MSDTGQMPLARVVPFWVKLVLALSLGLNLLVVGLAVGAAWRFAKGPPQDGPRAGFAFVSALEREDRRAVFAGLRDVRREISEEGRQDVVAILAVLRADKLDGGQLQDRMAGFDARVQGMRAAIQAGLVDRISAMSRDDRLAYADRLERRMEKGRRNTRDRD